MTKWYEVNVNYQDTKNIIRDNLANMSRTYIAIGFYLRQINDTEGYKEDGYESIWDFADDQYGIKRSTTSRWMKMNETFSENGNSPILSEKYMDFGKSQLQEMLYLDDEQIEEVTSDMTVKEIRDVKSPEIIEDDKKLDPEIIKCRFNEKYECHIREIMDNYFTKGGNILGCSGCCNICLIKESCQYVCECVKDSLEKSLIEYKTESVDELLEECATSHMDEPIDTEVTVIEEPDAELYEGTEERSDIEIAKSELEKAHQRLTDMQGLYSANDKRVRKQKLLVGALANFVCEMDDIINPAPAPEQPELPILRNMNQREAFVLGYKTWPVWCKNELTEETFYRYNLPDGSAIVVRSYPYCVNWEKHKEYEGKELYLLKDDTKHFKDGESNMTAVKEHLKEVQKEGK